jgi:geranylgeranyl reductase family protein
MTDNTENAYDVIIIGAGPAGSLAALNLAGAGYRVAIVEKSGISRNKICGGGITSRILKRFPYLEKDIDAVTLNGISEICFYSPALKTVRSKSDNPFYLMVERARFDSMLVAKCRKSGVTLIPSSKVTQVIIGKESVEVATQDGLRMTAKAVIGADGTNGITARLTKLNPRWPRNSIGICIVKETTGEPAELMDRKSIHVFYGYGGTAGYGWVFPKKKCINVGIGVITGRRINMRELWKSFVQELKTQKIVSRSFDDNRFKSGILPMGGPLSKTYLDRVLLCGDAGGFVNSYTAEGIYYSMVSGETAALALIGALKENDLSEKRLEEYQRLWKYERGTELEKANRIGRVVLGKIDLVDKIVAIANHDDRTKRALTDYSVGNIGYQDVKKVVLRQALPLYLELKIKRFFATALGRFEHTSE